MQSIITATGLQYLDILRFPPIAVEQGSVTFLCGKSGSGKSTLLKLFNATLSPTEGKIVFDGLDINDIEPITLRRQVLLAGQTVYLFDDTISGNFERFFAYRGEHCISEDEMREYLRLCCLELPLTANCHTLSGGERQRVFLGIHLAMRPRVLMLDEPTSALDKKTGQLLLESLKTYCKQEGITLVAISHDPALTKTYAEHLIVLGTEGCE